jgi:hypothetical protein
LKIQRNTDTLCARPELWTAHRVANQNGEKDAMKKPGLDHRHRDKDGTIQQKRSDAKNKNLNPPIPGFGPEITLGQMRKKTGKTSEKDIRAAMKK